MIDHLWHLTESGSYTRQGGPYPPCSWTLGSIVAHKHQKAAYCGIHHFDSDAYPPEYRGKLFMGNIHAGGINVDRVARDGASYRGSTEPDFLQANDAWFMPVVQKTGPDGSLYVLDWYDRYHCYQDANRDPAGIDRLKGRLYRIRYGETPRAPRFDMAGESDDQLIARLSAPNDYIRSTAQRLLGERNDVRSSPKLERIALDAAVERKVRLWAAWSLIGGGKLDPGFHRRLLADADPAFRAWGVRAAGNAGEVAPEVAARVVALAADPAPEVRVQVAIACRKIAGVDPLATLVACLGGIPEDPILAPIAWQNLHPILEAGAEEFLALVAKADLDRSPLLAETIPRAVDRLMGGSIPRAKVASALLALLLDRQADDRFAGPLQYGLEVMADRLGAPASPLDRDEVRARIAPKLGPILKAGAGSPVGVEAALVAVAWNDPEALASVRRVVAGAAGAGDDDQKARGLKALVDRRDPGLLGAIGPILADRRPGSARFRADLLGSLGRFDDPEVAVAVLAAYPGLDPDLQPKAIELLTQRAGWARALVGAVEGRVIAASTWNANQIRKVAGYPGLEARARALWGTVRQDKDPGREALIARVRGQLKDAHGDPAAGSLVFRNVCGQCHKIYGQGADVGPEITLNGRASYEQLLSNVFDPSLVIGPAYQATTVATVDGRTLTGLVVEDTPQRLGLKLQGGTIETIPRASVEEVRVSPLSLMPEGFEAQLKAGELADLFAFLTLDKAPGDPEARSLPGTPRGIRK